MSCHVNTVHASHILLAGKTILFPASDSVGDERYVNGGEAGPLVPANGARLRCDGGFMVFDLPCHLFVESPFFPVDDSYAIARCKLFCALLVSAHCSLEPYVLHVRRFAGTSHMHIFPDAPYSLVLVIPNTDKWLSNADEFLAYAVHNAEKWNDIKLILYHMVQRNLAVLPGELKTVFATHYQAGAPIPKASIHSVIGHIQKSEFCSLLSRFMGRLPANSDAEDAIGTFSISSKYDIVHILLATRSATRRVFLTDKGGPFELLGDVPSSVIHRHDLLTACVQPGKENYYVIPDTSLFAARIYNYKATDDDCIVDHIGHSPLANYGRAAFFWFPVGLDKHIDPGMTVQQCEAEYLRQLQFDQSYTINHETFPPYVMLGRVPARIIASIADVEEPSEETTIRLIGNALDCFSEIESMLPGTNFPMAYARLTKLRHEFDWSESEGLVPRTVDIECVSSCVTAFLEQFLYAIGLTQYIDVADAAWKMLLMLGIGDNTDQAGMILHGPPGTGKSHILQVLELMVPEFFVEVINVMSNRCWTASGARQEFFPHKVLLVDEGADQMMDDKNNRGNQNWMKLMVSAARIVQVALKLTDDGTRRMEKNVVSRTPFWMIATNYESEMNQALLDRLDRRYVPSEREQDPTRLTTAMVLGSKSRMQWFKEEYKEDIQRLHLYQAAAMFHMRVSYIDGLLGYADTSLAELFMAVYENILDPKTRASDSRLRGKTGFMKSMTQTAYLRGIALVYYHHALHKFEGGKWIPPTDAEITYFLETNNVVLMSDIVQAIKNPKSSIDVKTQAMLKSLASSDFIDVDVNGKPAFHRDTYYKIKIHEQDSPLRYNLNRGILRQTVDGGIGVFGALDSLARMTTGANHQRLLETGPNNQVFIHRVLIESIITEPMKEVLAYMNDIVDRHHIAYDADAMYESLDGKYQVVRSRDIFKELTEIPDDKISVSRDELIFLLRLMEHNTVFGDPMLKFNATTECHILDNNIEGFRDQLIDGYAEEAIGNNVYRLSGVFLLNTVAIENANTTDPSAGIMSPAVSLARCMMKRSCLSGERNVWGVYRSLVTPNEDTEVTTYDGKRVVIFNHNYIPKSRHAKEFNVFMPSHLQHIPIAYRGEDGTIHNGFNPKVDFDLKAYEAHCMKKFKHVPSDRFHLIKILDRLNAMSGDAEPYTVKPPMRHYDAKDGPLDCLFDDILSSI